MQEEIWKPVVGWERVYEVSNIGRVRGVDRIDAAGRRWKGRLMTLTPNPGGYQMVTLTRKGVGKPHSVHRLVVEAFIGPIPEGFQVNHRDGCKTNNCVDNLEIVTPSENTQHAYATGLARAVVRKGDEVAYAKLREADIPRIFELYASGLLQSEIGALFGVHKTTICNVLARRYWGHVAIDPDLLVRAQAADFGRKGHRDPQAKLTEEDVREIRKELLAGETQAELTRRYGVSATTISDIHLRKAWGWLD